MVKCNDDIIIKRGLRSLYVHCQLEKDHKSKHQYEGKSEGRVFWIEWEDELPVIDQ